LDTGFCLLPQVKSLLNWAQSVELISISGHQHEHKAEYINQTEHKPSAEIDTDPAIQRIKIQADEISYIPVRT
jgi:hypothetical protein